MGGVPSSFAGKGEDVDNMSREDKAEDSEEDSSAVCDCFDAVVEVED